MTAAPQFLRVRNWEHFQHYKDRRPPWIKYHVSILDDHTMLSLPPLTQLVYDRMLLRAALTDNNVENDPVWLARKFNLPTKDVRAALENLLDAGFLLAAGNKRAASKAIARRSQDASPHASRANALARGRSTETERTRAGAQKKTLRCDVAVCGLAFASAAKLADHRANVHGLPHIEAV